MREGIKTAPGSLLARLYSNPQLLTWGAVFLSVIVCLCIAWLHLRQKETLEREVVLLEDLGQARIDMASGFMHLSLGDNPASPFDRGVGHTLLQQGISSFEKACSNLSPANPGTFENFQHSIKTFRTLLEAFDPEAGVTPASAASLRIAFDDLETQATALDGMIKERLEAISSRFDSEFLIILSGSVLLLAGICTVIFHSTRAKATSDKTLQEHTLRLQLAVESGRVGLWDWNLLTNQLYLSPEWKQQIGFEDHEVVNQFKEWETRIHPDDLRNWQRAIQDFVGGVLDHLSIEYRLRHKDGNYRWIYAQASPLRDATGRLFRIVGSHIDISELRHAEEKLHRQEMLLREAGEIAHVGGWEFDPVSLKGNWTEETARIHECESIQELTAPMGLSFFQGRSYELIQAAVKEAIETGKPYDLELEMVTAKGNRRWIRTICHPILENGKPVRIRGSIQDITDRKLAETERDRLVAAIEQASEDVIITDASGTIVYVNPAFERLTGYSRGQVIGKNPNILKSGVHDRDFYHHLWSTIRQGEVWEGRIINKKKDGSLFTEEASISPIRDGSGSIVSFVSVKRDITEQLRLEEEKEHLQNQLIQAQKMEAVGRLAGGVAHDFNNMLQTILGYADLASHEVKEDGLLQECLQEIKKAGTRSADLTRQLLAFARRQTVSPKVLDLNDTVVSMLKMLQRLIGEDIDLAWMPGNSLWPVKIDPSQVNQILANLAVNARDAIMGVGKLTIETSNLTLTPAECTDHADTRPGDYVCLSVSDNGQGMDKETLAHIFEPFFTTKEVGKGTGLGLSTIYGIVRQNDGFIHVSSEPGMGTTFQIFFPRFSSGTVETTSAPTEGIPPRGNETILIVEDEDTVLLLAKRFLENLGYTLLIARTPSEAIDVAAHFPGEIHLLISDVVMPEMNGKELASLLTSGRPSLKTMFISGYTADVIANRGILDEGLLFVQKPFSAYTLGVAVHNALWG